MVECDGVQSQLLPKKTERERQTDKRQSWKGRWSVLLLTCAHASMGLSPNRYPWIWDPWGFPSLQLEYQIWFREW